MEIVDRVTAFQNRQLKYFTGRRCKHGHMSERYVKNGACISCLRPTHALELVRLSVRCHPDDAQAFRDMEEALLAARTAAMDDVPGAESLKEGQLPRAERERHWAASLLRNGQPWRPMPLAPRDPGFVKPEGSDPIY